MHIGHDVSSVDHQSGSSGHPQGNVQDRPVFGRVAARALEHGIASLGHPGPVGHVHQRGKCSVLDSVLRVVEDQITSDGDHRYPPAGIIGEELT